MKNSVKSINPWQSVILTSYDIVKAHGGSIQLKSQERVGTGFIIRLPVS